MRIESRSNETVKRVKSLAEAKYRQASGLHLIEGEHLLREAIASQVQAETAFFEEGYEDAYAAEREALKAGGAAVYTVTRPVMEALCDTRTPQRVCAAVHTPRFIEEFPAGLIAALDAVQDPGNLGTILRTADAMGVCCLLLGDGCADPYSPKAIRAAMGSTYHVPLYRGPLSPALLTLRGRGCRLVCGHLRASETLPEPGRDCAVVIGNEGNGVSEEIAALCELVRLPMYGRAESLNASVAAGLLLYEMAKRMHKN